LRGDDRFRAAEPIRLAAEPTQLGAGFVKGSNAY